MQVIDQNSTAWPHTNPLWQLALQLGAQCTLDVTAESTHVVTLSAQTAKAQQGRELGKHVVSPDWLVECDARCALKEILVAADNHAGW
jgi:twin BRCT domain